MKDNILLKYLTLYINNYILSDKKPIRFCQGKIMTCELKLKMQELWMLSITTSLVMISSHVFINSFTAPFLTLRFIRVSFFNITHLKMKYLPTDEKSNTLPHLSWAYKCYKNHVISHYKYLNTQVYTFLFQPGILYIIFSLLTDK
jgi:hypothetical protein